MNKKEDQEFEINVLELIKYVWKHVIILAMVLLIGAGLSFAVSKFVISPMYTSTSMIYIGGSGGGGVSSMLSMLQIGNALTADYQNLATSQPVVERLIDDFKLDTDYEELKERIHTDNPTNTRMLTFSIDDEDPDLAKNLVDDLTNIMVEQATDVMGATEPVIIHQGDSPKEPSSPNIVMNTLAGGVIALILALAVLLFTFIKKNSLNSEKDLIDWLGLENLGTIPIAEPQSLSKKNTKNIEKAGEK